MKPIPTGILILPGSSHRLLLKNECLAMLLGQNKLNIHRLNKKVIRSWIIISSAWSRKLPSINQQVADWFNETTEMCFFSCLGSFIIWIIYADGLLKWCHHAMNTMKLMKVEGTWRGGALIKCLQVKKPTISLVGLVPLQTSLTVLDWSEMNKDDSDTGSIVIGKR